MCVNWVMATNLSTIISILWVLKCAGKILYLIAAPLSDAVIVKPAKRLADVFFPQFLVEFEISIPSTSQSLICRQTSDFNNTISNVYM